MAKSRPYARGMHGFSVAEVLTILTAFTVLGGLTAPAIYDYVEDARVIRARHDATTIAVSLVRLFDDVGARGRRPKGWASYDLLVGAGVGTGSRRATRVSAWAIPANACWCRVDRRPTGQECRGLFAPSNVRPGRLARPVCPEDGRRRPVGSSIRGERSGPAHAGVRYLRSQRGSRRVVTTPFDVRRPLGARDDIAALVSSSGLGR